MKLYKYFFIGSTSIDDRKSEKCFCKDYVQTVNSEYGYLIYDNINLNHSEMCTNF